jgi:alkylhydroperoxidase family enzyme
VAGQLAVQVSISLLTQKQRDRIAAFEMGARGQPDGRPQYHDHSRKQAECSITNPLPATASRVGEADELRVSCAACRLINYGCICLYRRDWPDRDSAGQTGDRRLIDERKPGDTPTENSQGKEAAAREAQIFGDGPRLQPMELSEISNDLLAILAQMERVNGILQSSADGDRGGTEPLRTKLLTDPEGAAASTEILAGLSQLPEIVRTMLRHAELFAVHTDVGLHLLSDGTLSLHDREFAVLRIAWLCQAPYEWGEHVLVAKRFGLTSVDIARIIEGPDADGLDEHEGAILRAVDELHADSMISDATWATLAKRFDERQLIELPIIVGQYQTVAYYQNSLRLRLHTGNQGLKAR